MATGDSWTTIESDPGVFTELMAKMGAQGVEMAELWSCDPDSLAALQPIYGLIFLFKWQKEADERGADPDAASRGVFFANQVINNACATQAIISVLMNVPEGTPGFDLGPELTRLRDFTADFPPDMRGEAIGNSDTIRAVHNSFHPPQPLLPDEKEEREKDADAFHFVAYVPAAGGLYELDGLKPGPIRLCDCEAGEWLGRASEAVSARIACYSAAEQRFNLMAVVRSRLDMAREELAAATAAGAEGAAAAAAAAVAAEEAKRRRWADENLRRRTDFTPFAFNLLKALAEGGKLAGMVAGAEEARRVRPGSQQA